MDLQRNVSIILQALACSLQTAPFVSMQTRSGMSDHHRQRIPSFLKHEQKPARSNEQAFVNPIFLNLRIVLPSAGH
jgi:hypothetical protein